jgi:DNA-binding MarR family transcriptional regulator
MSNAGPSLPDRLHAWAIHLLRWLREADRSSPLSAAELSALSVVVHLGPLSLTELAEAEQVRPPSMSRLISGLEGRGLVDRDRSAEDRRVVRISATVAGLGLLEEGRQRRLHALRAALDELGPVDRRALDRAVGVLERLLPE